MKYPGRNQTCYHSHAILNTKKLNIIIKMGVSITPIRFKNNVKTETKNDIRLH